jgi:four helix bundle protein
MGVKNFKETKLYQKAFGLAMEIFEITKSFPKSETYSIIDQIRRSSRSVCSCLAEAYRKKIYPAHFIAKISDADMENSETSVWIDFSFRCGYIDKATYDNLILKMRKWVNCFIICFKTLKNINSLLLPIAHCPLLII